MTTLETIVTILREELRVPDGYQLMFCSTPNSIRLIRPDPSIYYYFYIIVEPDHVVIREWSHQDLQVPYANPLLVETIQQLMNDHITRTKEIN